MGFELKTPKNKPKKKEKKKKRPKATKQEKGRKELTVEIVQSAQHGGLIIRFISHRVIDGYTNENNWRTIKTVGKRYPSDNLAISSLRRCGSTISSSNATGWAL